MAALLLLSAIAPGLVSAAPLHLRSSRQGDPAHASTSPLASLGLPEHAGDAWLVQRRGPIDAGFRAAVETAGARIVGFVPENAYLVRVEAGRVDALRRLGDVARVEPYRPLDRLAPALASALTGSPACGSAVSDTIALRISGFRGEDVEAIAARASAAVPAAVLLAASASEAGRPSLVLDLPRHRLGAALHALATDAAVEFVAPEPRALPQNSDASWVLQSGQTAIRPLFQSAGITGVGQIVALADVGIDSAACQFNFTPGPGTAPNNTQAPQANVTNPADKVVSYYLATGADAGDAAVTNWHGSGVAASMAGDNGKSPATIAPRSNPYTFPLPDSGDGMAPGAQLVVQDIATSDGYFVLGLNQDSLLTQAYRSGARVHNSSYGLVPIDTGSGVATIYDGSAADVDEALWRMRDLSAVWAAGNWGAIDPATGSPWDGQRSLSGLGAVAKNSITVGATGNPGAPSESVENLLGESARGPSLEGLWKPDVVAPGHNLSAIDDGTPASCATQRRVALGTSFAAAAVTGMAALARQYFSDGYYPTGLRTRANVPADPELFNPSNALVKAILVNSARSLGGNNTGDRSSDPCPGTGCAAPSYGQGWGRIALDDALYLSGDARRLLLLADIWNGSTNLENVGRGDALTLPAGVPRGALITHETHNYAFELASASQGPLRCTLAWSDPAAAPGAAQVLVNDLDLELHDPGPDGVVGTPDDLYYHGNQFLDSAPFSDAAATGWDATNATENIWIQVPHVGIYNLRVFGRSVPGNGQRDIAAEPPLATARINSWLQGYALLCTGDSAVVKSIPLITASANPDPSIGCVEDSFQVSFDASCSTCVAWEWDFGDGGSSTLKNPTHLFTSAGLYLVTVTGRDAAGVEARLSLPFEAIVGNKAPAGAVGNSFRMGKLPPASLFSHAGYWSDIGVPAATTYQLWEFASPPDVSSSPPVGTLIPPNPNPLIHGLTGVGWNPGPAAFLLYQIRAANCLQEPGP